MKKGAAIILIMVLLIPGNLCQNLSVYAAQPILSKKKLTMTAGETKTIKVKKVRRGQKVKWKSSKSAIASVNQKGKIKAKRAGKTTITAKVAKRNLKCKVTVKTKEKENTNLQPEETEVPVSTAAPETIEKKVSDVDALNYLITLLKQKGASISDDIDDTTKYKWEDRELVEEAGKYEEVNGEFVQKRKWVSRLTEINWRGCHLSEELSLSGFDRLKSVDLSNNQLTLLDISQCPALESLNCQENRLSSLYFYGSEKLTYLDCQHNQLTELNIGNSKSLQNLYCGYNYLKTLDISDQTGLSVLVCDYNYLSGLDIRKCTALTSLGCAHNRLVSLDISENLSLTHLDCQDNQLKELDASKNKKLDGLVSDQEVNIIKDVS